MKIEFVAFYIGRSNAGCVFPECWQTEVRTCWVPSSSTHPSPASTPPQPSTKTCQNSRCLLVKKHSETVNMFDLSMLLIHSLIDKIVFVWCGVSPLLSYSRLLLIFIGFWRLLQVNIFYFYKKEQTIVKWTH